MPSSLATLHDQRIGTELDRSDGMLECTHGGNAEHTRCLETLNGFGIWRTAVTHCPNLLSDTDVHDPVRMGHIHVKVDAKGRIGALADCRNTLLNFLGGHDRARQESKSSRSSRGRDKLRVSDPTHRRLYDGVSASQ